MDRHDDVRFRGKPINELTREEAIEALSQALSRVKELEGHDGFTITIGGAGRGGSSVPGVWDQSAGMPKGWESDPQLRQFAQPNYGLGGVCFDRGR
jgi:hypothetical protein